MDIRSDTLKTDRERPFYVLIGPQWGGGILPVLPLDSSSANEWEVFVNVHLYNIIKHSFNIHSTFVNRSLTIRQTFIKHSSTTMEHHSSSTPFTIKHTTAAYQPFIKIQFSSWQEVWQAAISCAEKLKALPETSQGCGESPEGGEMLDFTEKKHVPSGNFT